MARLHESIDRLNALVEAIAIEPTQASRALYQVVVQVKRAIRRSGGRVVSRNIDLSAGNERAVIHYTGDYDSVLDEIKKHFKPRRGGMHGRHEFKFRYGDYIIAIYDGIVAIEEQS